MVKEEGSMPTEPETVKQNNKKYIPPNLSGAGHAPPQLNTQWCLGKGWCGKKKGKVCCKRTT